MRKRKPCHLLRCERGESMVSYALLVTLIALMCIPSIRHISHGVGATACSLEHDEQRGGQEYFEDGHCWGLGLGGDTRYPGMEIW